MTRTLFVIAGLGIVLLIGSFIVGLTSSAPALLLVSMLCAGPVSMFALGAAIGRASNEFQLIRKERRAGNAVSAAPVSQVNSRLAAAKAREPLG